MSELRFHDLLDRYLSGSLNAEEFSDLLIYIRQEKNREQLEAAIANALAARRFEGLADHAHADNIFQQIMQKAGEYERQVPAPEPLPELQPSRKIFPFRRAAAAAAIFISLCTGIYLWLSRDRKPHQQVLVSGSFKNDVAPGGNKAVLTLAGGQTIVLDSAHIGQISTQANVNIIKSDSGKLVYDILKEKPTALLYNTLTTPRGGQYQLALPDGSKVWLNAASSIKYPIAFIGKERMVEITGEAYFEVVHNANWPFKVKVGDQVIEDIGTAFNINAYADESVVKTTLLEGSVKVAIATSSDRQPKDQQTVTLKPGQQAMVNQAAIADQKTNNGDVQIKVIKGVDMEQVMAWKNGLFSFKGADLQTVLRQLTRWYDVDVIYEGQVPLRHFSGEIGRMLTLDQVLKLLTQTQVNYTIENKRLTIRP